MHYIFGQLIPQEKFEFRETGSGSDQILQLDPDLTVFQKPGQDSDPKKYPDSAASGTLITMFYEIIFINHLVR